VLSPTIQPVTKGTPGDLFDDEKKSVGEITRGGTIV
jgi:hypothetical protein